MKVLNCRHFGIQVSDIENSILFYQKKGFTDMMESGDDTINGLHVTWVKLRNEHGVVIELCQGWPGHLAFTVDTLDYSKYVQIAPSRHRVQFEHDPDGNIIELVQEPKK